MKKMFWFLALSSRKALLTKSVCAERENEFVSCLFNPFCKRKNIKQQNGVQKSNFNQNNSFRKGNKDFHLTDGQNPFIYVRCFLSRFWFEIQRGTLIMWWNIWLLDSSLIIKVLWLGCRIRFIRGTLVSFSVLYSRTQLCIPKIKWYHLIFGMLSWVFESVYVKEEDKCLLVYDQKFYVRKYCPYEIWGSSDRLIMIQSSADCLDSVFNFFTAEMAWR